MTTIADLGPTELSAILEYVSNPLDKFHFSAAVQKTENGRNMFDEDKPRHLFKKVHKRWTRRYKAGRKRTYAKPPTLRQACKMTSAWVKKKGICWECFEGPQAVHVDLFRDDRHPRCWYCLQKHYQYNEEKGFLTSGPKAKICPCGSPLILERHTMENRCKKGKLWFLVLDCRKREAWDQCTHSRDWQNPCVQIWKRYFMRDYGHKAKRFDPSKCIPRTYISNSDQYWSPIVEKNRGSPDSPESAPRKVEALRRNPHRSARAH